LSTTRDPDPEVKGCRARRGNDQTGPSNNGSGNRSKATAGLQKYLRSAFFFRKFSALEKKYHLAFLKQGLRTFLIDISGDRRSSGVIKERTAP